MDDVLEIVTEPEVVKGASINLHQRVMRGDQILVEASVRVAFVSGGRARPIPKSVAHRHARRPGGAILNRPLRIGAKGTCRCPRVGCYRAA